MPPNNAYRIDLIAIDITISFRNSCDLAQIYTHTYTYSDLLILDVESALKSALQLDASLTANSGGVDKLLSNVSELVALSKRHADIMEKAGSQAARQQLIRSWQEVEDSYTRRLKSLRILARKRDALANAVRRCRGADMRIMALLTWNVWKV